MDCRSIALAPNAWFHDYNNATFPIDVYLCRLASHNALPDSRTIWQVA